MRNTHKFNDRFIYKKYHLTVEINRVTNVFLKTTTQHDAFYNTFRTPTEVAD